MTDSIVTNALPGSPAGVTRELGEVIVARVGAGRIAVALTSVAEVGRVPQVTRMPGVPPWVAGAANWRGRILPVLDLRSLLGADVGTLTPAARLLVLADGPMTVGVLVDSVEGTSVLDDVAAVPAARGPVGAELICGQSPRTDGPIAVLDVGAVVRLREGLPRGR